MLLLPDVQLPLHFTHRADGRGMLRVSLIATRRLPAQPLFAASQRLLATQPPRRRNAGPSLSPREAAFQQEDQQVLREPLLMQRSSAPAGPAR